MELEVEQRIFPVTKTVWKYDAGVEYGPYQIEIFFQQFGLKVVSAPGTAQNEYSEDWLTFRTADGFPALVSPSDYIVINGFADAEVMTAEEFEKAGTTPA